MSSGRNYGRRGDAINTTIMYEEYCQGLSLADVAKDWGTTRQSVYKRFRRAGLQLRTRKAPAEVLEYGGRRFTRSSKGYWRATTGDRAPVHHVVYRAEVGEIPAGHEVHVGGTGDPLLAANLTLVNLVEIGKVRKPRHPVLLRDCPVCGQVIKRHSYEGPAAYRKRKTCSHRCSRALLKGGRRGDDRSGR